MIIDLILSSSRQRTVAFARSIICRGIEQQRIFDEDADRDNLLEHLGAMLNETSTPCHG